MASDKGTKVYGCSDDLIEFDGDVSGEVNHYGTDDEKQGMLLIFSDGTLLEAKYGKGGEGVWAITLLRRGDLLIGIEQVDISTYTDGPDEPNSDVATFKPGLTWCREATNWRKVS